jgi:hypothetical protein
LTERGRRAAQEAGYPNPTSEHAIHFGLLESARLDPLEVEPDKVPNLVRLALFDIDALEGEPDAELIEAVTERMLVAIEQHLDDTTEDFERWFFASDRSVLKQISQQKKRRGGRLRRADVRQAMLHLCWQAYEYVGQCVHALMRMIKNSIPNLGEAERRIYEHAYEAQPYYGGLPLALLAERRGFLRHAVLAIWEEPHNQDHVRALHRLLAYYAHMASARRCADRRSKEVCSSARVEANQPSTDRDGSAGIDATTDRFDGPDETCHAWEDGGPASRRRRGAIQTQFIDNLHGRGSPVDDRFADLADYIRESAGVECDQGCEQWEHEMSTKKDGAMTFVFRCRCGRTAKSVRMRQEEVVELGRELFDIARGSWLAWPCSSQYLI